MLHHPQDLGSGYGLQVHLNAELEVDDAAHGALKDLCAYAQSSVEEVLSPSLSSVNTRHRSLDVK